MLKTDRFRNDERDRREQKREERRVPQVGIDEFKRWKLPTGRLQRAVFCDARPCNTPEAWQTFR